MRLLAGDLLDDETIVASPRGIEAEIDELEAGLDESAEIARIDEVAAELGE